MTRSLRSMACSVLIATALFVFAGQSAVAYPISLDGFWRFELDSEDRGVQQQWFNRDLRNRIRLPGILQAQGFGDDITTNTPWVLSLYDHYWYLREDYKAYTDLGKVQSSAAQKSKPVTITRHRDSEIARRHRSRIVQAEPTATRAWKFDFGPGPVAHGYQQVLPQNIYSREAGFGFEPGAQITCVNHKGKDSLRNDFCTSDKPFYFSVALPEGNYNVTVTLGDAEGESVSTIKAELRRLMMEKVETKRGKFEPRTFTVNVRTPQINGDAEVKLKDREKTTEIWNWDEKLTLEFNNASPKICALEIVPVNVPTIFLLGDSTVCDQPLEPYNSWGQMLTRFFRSNIAIANHAESGESLRSSLGAKRLDKVLSVMKPGDYLFIQYGHNDEKEKGEGVGAFTTYKADLKKFVDGARARGGIPVLITPVQRRSFDKDGKITNSHGDYPEAMRQVAREENVPLIDLNAMSKPLYEAWGVEVSKRAFAPNDNTHHNNYGSYELARCIVEGIRASKLGIAKYLVTGVPRFDPQHPDPFDSFKVPPSPLITDAKPLGR